MKNKVPYIEQMNESECGIACVAMISSYFGKHIDISDLRDLFGTSRDGLTLTVLSNLCDMLDLDSKAFMVNTEELKKLKFPVILHWDYQHFVVFEGYKRKKFHIVDPDRGRRKLKTDEIEKHFSGTILSVIPNNNFYKKKPKPLWRPYLSLLWKKPILLLSMLLLSIFLQSFVIISPLLTQYIVDRSTSKFSDFSFVTLLLAIGLSLISYISFNILRNEVSIKLFEYLDFKLSWKFFSHLLNVPYTFFQNRKSADLLYRFSNLRSIRNVLSSQFMKSLLDMILVITIFVYMFNKSPMLALLLMALTSLLALTIFSFRSRMNDLNRLEVFEDTKLYSFQSESIMGIHDIKSSGLEQTYSQKWKDMYNNFSTAFVNRERLIGIVTAISSSFNFFIPVFILLVGMQSVLNGIITLGELIAFQTISAYFLNTSNSLIMQIEAYYQLKVYLKRLQDVFNTPLEITEETKEKHIIQGEIEFQNVSFSFTQYGKNVINNASFHISAGEKVAIVGKSGSGKSTLANLILGIYPLKNGIILYDKKDISSLDKPTLRKQIGIVTQKPYLFNKSIFENIVANREGVTLDMVIEAAKIAEIHEEIMKLPLNYHTIISEQAKNFSGGQIQRISIARALVGNPKIIIFDEATNALDSITEKKIDDHLSKLNATRIIIAHRLSTIKNADRIIVMDDGEIVAQGKHEELITSNDYYISLYKHNNSLELLNI
ncbi:ABC transporter family protein [Anoxybacillus sp. B7M1]|uniref:peptidase domain-containing ABC transporter n=1 Tax=unclassified Anoxybacillus TaxID=2639704 RepID=UPI0005CD4B6F|nr:MULTISPECIES: peptidase domain-containing ABC transporter [unclassified Anoxybacillus]ANB57633.1 ABC transporter family protein [Anoxybacillus sp. B2M1]ANB64728.1 ABC transporter family protein [Anoxybacillus sp. B7M1]